jgi:hypothetical protein
VTASPPDTELDTTPGSLTPAARVFAALAGDWRIDRRVDTIGRFVGSARIVAATMGVGDGADDGDGVLLYHERGLLQPARGPAIEAHRAFEYRLQHDRIDVYFGEARRAGQRYITLRFAGADGGGLAADDLHPCGEDLYHHQFCWQHADAFSTRVRITGPHKDYLVESRYTRRRSTG